MKEITDEKLERYFTVTGRALDKVRFQDRLEFDWREKFEDFLDMAKRYFEDAKYFEEKGDFVNAFAALNYSHGWLDAGARIGLFDVDGDSELFTVDKEMFQDKTSSKP